MSDDYLWDGSGTPDPDVQRMEDILSPFAYAGPTRPRRTIPRWPFIGLAAAAILGVSALGVWWMRPVPDQPGPYRVARTAGETSVDGRPVGPNAVLSRGQLVVTGPDAGAVLDVPEIGHLELKPSTRLRLVDVTAQGHQLYLEQGGIRAFIAARPRFFQVGTLAGLAVDLGCLYDLSVGDDGEAVLLVQLGQVSFEWNGRKILVPAGARCRARPGVGPGTPVRTDAEPAYQGAVDTFDRGGSLEPVLDGATADDAVTLFALLTHPDLGTRRKALARLTVFHPTHQGDPDAILRNDPEALRAYREALDLGW